MNDGPLVSVVVPVFNAERWLSDTLESFDRQQYEHIEWILVDDGSDDASYEIAESWEPRNGVVQVLRKRNGGASSARNVGLRAASGDYVIFWDSDDTQNPEMLRKMASALQQGADIAICAVNRIERNRRERALFVGRSETVNSETALRKWLNHDLSSGPYTKMIKRDLLLAHSIEFAEGEISEDIIWTVQIIIAAKRIALLGEPLYNYISREGSVTNTLDERYLIEFENAQRLRNLISEHASRLSELCEVHCAQRALNAAFRLLCRTDGQTRLRLSSKVMEEYRFWLPEITSMCRGPKDMVKRILIAVRIFQLRLHKRRTGFRA